MKNYLHLNLTKKTSKYIGLFLVTLLFAFSQKTQAQSIDLSTYVRVGRYSLPEPTTVTPPANSLLAQEVSAVTYNWDTNTLFVVGDGSTSIVQVTKQGQLINSMTLALGSSPQGTEFYDTEGLTYIGNGEFVMSEERDRQVVKFTYVAGSTLVRANTQTVKLGTFVNNIGTEGLSFDPITGGYIVLKEINPIGIFQTNIDFANGTATNGSASTVNSVNLFDPALLGVTDVADVFALSNLAFLNGQPQFSNLLVLSQENARIVNVSRTGVIANSLQIVSDPGNPLDVASQQHEGLTMDNEGILYVVSENGGGDIDHPQLWVYAPSTLSNQAPTAVTLSNVTNTILENTSTTAPIKVADIVVTDDGLGTNLLSLSGTDAAFFEITGTSLYIKAGTVLDYETQITYNITINVDDTTVGTNPDASVSYTLTVLDVLNETPQTTSVTISEVAPWSSSNGSTIAADWFEVTNTGTTAINLTGWKMDDNSNSYASSVPLNGITTIAPGESVIFLEASASNPSATVIANFKSVWFGANPPASLQVGTYQGSGVGLSSGGDAVNLYDNNGILKANLVFVASPAGPFKTFNNALGLNNTIISLLSEVKVNDAFVAVNDVNEIGSPGSIGHLFISEVAPWSSGNSPVAADWFEVTNTKAVPYNITGWKIDDNSQSPAGAVALNGITSINPGESVIFIETADLAGKTTAFLNNWFGTNPTSGLRIGNYTGSGVGLSSGGDQVNLYNGVDSTPVASVIFGTSPTGTFATFDNAAGITTITTPITQLSAVGVYGAFIAFASPNEIGSPGTIVTAPCGTITATATPDSASICTGSTTNVTVSATGGTLPYVITGSTLNVGAGTYNYTITDAKGCSTTASTTITLANACSGPSTLVSPYVLPVVTAVGATTTSMLTVPETVGGYRMAGIPDGLGAYDNNNGTFTLLMNHELGNTSGIVRAHGGIGSFVSKWIVNKSDLSFVSGSDLITSVYGWNTSTQRSNTTTGIFNFNRFCSADLPSPTAFYNAATGLGTQERLFMHGEEGGATGYQLATVATGSNTGKAYILGKFNVTTNGSGLTGVGAWENALANPYQQNKTIVVGNNDGGTGVMNNSIAVYVGTKTNVGTEVDKAGLTNGTLNFVNVTGNPVEIVNTTSRATNITSGTAFTLNGTTSTTFSRPEDGAWDPTNPSKYYFVTTDRLDQVADGIGSQIGRSRLWRLNFTDITNPDLGGTIDLLLDGTEGQIMMDNMGFDNYGHILLLEDVGNAAHNGKVWQYTIATDTMKLIAKHDAARFGDIGVPTTAPFTQDEETSGIIDVSSILGAGNFLVVDQAHYSSGIPADAVEGGQLLKLYNPDSFAASQCATTSTETISACGNYEWNGTTYNQSGTYTFQSLNTAGCFNIATLNLTIATDCTSIQASQCGTTLSTVNQYIYGNLISGVQAYRFKVTDLTTNSVQTIDKALRVFALTQLPNFAFDRTYSVEIAVRKNNVWLPYGSSCNVTTPIVTTNVISSQCSTIVTNPTLPIYANLVSFATGYRFRITNTTNPADVQTADRALREVRLSSFALPVQPGTVYYIDVAVRNTDGTFLPYGSVCTLTTPGSNNSVVANTSKEIDKSLSNELIAVSYPNPFLDTFNLQVNSNSEEVISVKVYNMLGKLIEDKEVNFNDISSLPIGESYSSGVYNVIVSQGNEIKSLRVIKR